MGQQQAKSVMEDAGGNVRIVHIIGSLDMSNVDEVFDPVYEMAKQLPEQGKLIVNLEDLSYLNSKGIGYLTCIYVNLKEKEGDMALTNIKPNVLDVLHLVGLDQMLEICESIEEAKKKLGITQ